MTRLGYFGVQLTLYELILGLCESILCKYQTSLGFEGRFLHLGIIDLCESLMRVDFKVYCRSLRVDFGLLGYIWNQVLIKSCISIGEKISAQKAIYVNCSHIQYSPGNKGMEVVVILQKY